MKKSYILGLIVILLSALAFFIYSNSKKGESSLGPESERDFKIQNPDEVGKIFIAVRNGQKATLEKKNGVWYLDNKYLAHKHRVGNLLNVMSRIQVEMPVQKNQLARVIKAMSNASLKTEIYSTSGKLLKSYYVGGTPNNEDGNFFMMEGSNNPYLVRKPGLPGQVRIYYDMKYDQWRENDFIAFDVNELKEVSASYSRSPQLSFTIKKENNIWQLIPKHPSQKMQNANPSSVEGYLKILKEIKIAKFLNVQWEKDTVNSKLPFVVFDFTLNDNKKIQYKTVEVLDRDGEGRLRKVTEADGTIRTLVESFAVLTSEDDLMVLQDKLIQPAFKNYLFFTSKK
jgi:hypothetical protein